MIWPCNRRASGFTLVEVLVVLAIMAIMAAIVVPLGRFQRQNAELAAAARQIADALRLTRSAAIADNRSALFVVDVEKNAFRAAGTASPQALPRRIRVTLLTSADAVANSHVGAIRFYPDGSSTGGAVTLDDAARGYVVRVDWLTGGISVHEQSDTAKR